MPSILHVTAHLGGGVGKVLSSIAIHEKNENSDFSHQILTLEPTINRHFEQICFEHEIPIIMARGDNIPALINSADVMQIEWWHHPLTMGFMYQYLSRIPSRLIIWSHISGCNFPNISPDIVNFADAFVFSSEYSYDNPTWTEKERRKIINTTRVVVSSGIDLDAACLKVSHDGFNVGYVGYLGYNKTHPDYVKFCESASNIPGIHFIVVGDIAFGGKLVADASKSTASDLIHFTGYRSDLHELLSCFDVFGYPLNPEHTGTAENALLEAMAAGITPVVLDQCSEKYIVTDKKTGLIVRNIEEYGNALRWLYENPSLRLELGKAASSFVKENYNISVTCAGLKRIYSEILCDKKKLHDTATVFGDSPLQWFRSCYVGDMEKINGLAAGENKSGILQYKKYYPGEEFQNYGQKRTQL